MKYILFSLGLFLLSCNPSTSNPNEESYTEGDFVVRTIDSCEYIEYDYGIVDQRVYSLTHKGNCKHCKRW